jgi:hypothetical protein
VKRVHLNAVWPAQLRDGMADTENGKGQIHEAFDEREMDKLIRQIVDKVRVNYLQNGETARGIPGEVKRIIELNIDRF